MIAQRLALAWVLLPLIGLSCCTVQPTAYRDLSKPIGATTRFDADRFYGQWTITASFTPQQEAPVTFVQVGEADRLQVLTDEIPRIAGLYRQGVPGELIPLSGQQETLVVMWVDDDFRTAAIGTVSGTIGLVLDRDRDGETPADRVVAVRDVFDFYGWDTSQLKRTN